MTRKVCSDDGATPRGGGYSAPPDSNLGGLLLRKGGEGRGEKGRGKKDAYRDKGPPTKILNTPLSPNCVLNKITVNKKLTIKKTNFTTAAYN